MQELNQLKEVVGPDYPPEDRAYITELEKRLQLEVIKENFTRNSVVEQYMESLRGEIARCKEQLSEQEDLPDRDRLKLFARIKACRDFLSHFEPKRTQVEQTIKQTLDEAYRQS